MEDGFGMNIFDGTDEGLFSDEFALGDGVDPNELNDNNNINDGEGDDPNDAAAGNGDNSDEGDGSETVADEDGQDEGEDNNSPNLFSSVATLLHEEGVLPSLDVNDGIESVDGLAKAVTTEVESLYKAKLIERFGEDGYEYVNSGVPIKEYQEYEDRSDLLGSITEESLNKDINLGKQVIFQDYINKGMSEELATKYVERVAATGDDIVAAQAAESLNSLKQFNKASIDATKSRLIQEQADADAAKIAEEKAVKDSVYGMKELVKGLPVNKNVQDSVYGSITNVVGRNPETGESENALMRSRRENPIEFNTKLYYIYEMTKGFSDFSAFGKASKKSTIKDFEKAARSHIRNGGDAPGFAGDNYNYGDGNFGDKLIM